MEGLYIMLGMAILCGIAFLIIFKLQDAGKNTVTKTYKKRSFYEVIL